MNFDLFCNKQKKNLVTAITFAYDVEKTRFIYQKKTREKTEFNFTRVYPVSNSQILQIRKEKKVISNRRFFPTKSKKNQTIKNIKKNSKKDTGMYNKEDC